MSKKDKPYQYIYINIPEYKMYFMENEEEIFSMDVIVGKKENKTPIFSENLSYVVINSEWNVPNKIYQNEYLEKDKNYLYKKGFKFVNGKLIQKAGNNNALGLVKFIFPNKFAVYMHDTPAKYLFKNKKRAFSHGCIRLSQPFELLEYLGIEYEPEAINKKIYLEEKIPVYIEYNTVWVDANWHLQMREDIYGYENLLF